MTANEKTDPLVDRLIHRLITASDGRVTGIIQEARDEALAEVKSIIKEVLIPAMLEQALRELGETESEPMPEDEAPAQPQEAATQPDEASVEKEIEAIKRKIAENERVLSQSQGFGSSEEDAVPSHPAAVETPNQRMEEDYGYYVYAVVACDGDQPLGGLPTEGIDPAFPVYFMAYRSIQAVVSKVSLQEFGQEVLETNLNDMAWLETKVRTHQDVAETVSADRALVPLRFCTVYLTESRVQEALVERYDDFANALARLKGKQEWGVKVYCDGNSLMQRVRDVSDRVKELEAEMAQKPSGVAYFMKRKMEEVIAEEIERISDEYAQSGHDRLSHHAQESDIHPLQGKELTDRKEAMVLNGAYLVDEDDLAAFRAELRNLGVEHGDLGFTYELTGPWPPYSFVAQPGETWADE